MTYDYLQQQGGQYSGNGYGNGGEGGGFMPQSPATAMQQSPASGLNSGAKKQSLNQTIRPLSIKQLLDAQPSPVDSNSFVIDGAELGIVSVVGCVRKIVQQSTNTCYTVEDGTGSLDVRQWSDGQETDLQTGLRASVRENTYVRVYGTVRGGQARQKNVSVMSIRPVTDFNEITFHLLDAISAHLQLSRGSFGGNNNNQQASAGGNGMLARMPQGMINQHSAYSTSSNLQQKYGQEADEFTPLQRQILELAGQLGRDASGVKIDLLTARTASSGFPDGAVSDAIDQLLNDGHLYHSVDGYCKLSI